MTINEANKEKNIEGFNQEDTVIIWSEDTDLLNMVFDQCRALNVKLCRAEQVEDVLAVRAFLNIIDRGLLSDRDLDILRSFLEDIDDASWKVLLTGASVSSELPGKNLIRMPERLTDDFIKFLILKTRSTYKRRRAIWEKTERRIVRLVYMMRILESGRSFLLRNIAKEFDVSLRTVQRDMEVLEMGGFPIMTDKKGSYRLPEDFRIYDFYFDQYEQE